MQFKLIVSILFSVMLISINFAQAAVVLVYHHVNTHSPKSTTISPSQFAAHLNYINENDFNVVPLNVIVDSIKNQTPLPDKTLAITFDDGYSDIYHNAHPLLQAHSFPYTVFINPAVVPKKTGLFLNWQDLKSMSADGVMIANHGLEHQSLIKVPKGYDAKQWVDERLADLQQAEHKLQQNLGQSWQYYALPYGEYSQYAQQQLEKLGFTVFTQQSGAIGLSTLLTAIPRFPASQPYDKLSTLKAKLNSLPFDISKQTQQAETLVRLGETADTEVALTVNDFYPKMLQCFVSGVGSVETEWSAQQSFTLKLNKTLSTGRTRSNCTAPSISKPGRYYWYSRPWFVPKADGSWYSW